MWCGIELDDPVGKSNGIANNVRYFICKENHGTFVPVCDTTRINYSDDKSFAQCSRKDFNNESITHFLSEKLLKTSSSKTKDSLLNLQETVPELSKSYSLIHSSDIDLNKTFNISKCETSKQIDVMTNTEELNNFVFDCIDKKNQLKMNSEKENLDRLDSEESLGIIPDLLNDDETFNLSEDIGNFSSQNWIDDKIIHELDLKNSFASVFSPVNDNQNSRMNNYLKNISTPLPNFKSDHRYSSTPKNLIKSLNVGMSENTINSNPLQDFFHDKSKEIEPIITGSNQPELEIDFHVEEFKNSQPLTSTSKLLSPIKFISSFSLNEELNAKAEDVNPQYNEILKGIENKINLKVSQTLKDQLINNCNININQKKRDSLNSTFNVKLNAASKPVDFVASLPNKCILPTTKCSTLTEHDRLNNRETELDSTFVICENKINCNSDCDTTFIVDSNLTATLEISHKANHEIHFFHHDTITEESLSEFEGNFNQANSQKLQKDVTFTETDHKIECNYEEDTVPVDTTLPKTITNVFPRKDDKEISIPSTINLVQCDYDSHNTIASSETIEISHNANQEINLFHCDINSVTEESFSYQQEKIKSTTFCKDAEFEGSFNNDSFHQASPQNLQTDVTFSETDRKIECNYDDDTLPLHSVPVDTTLPKTIANVFPKKDEEISTPSIINLVQWDYDSHNEMASSETKISKTFSEKTDEKLFIKLLKETQNLTFSNEAHEEIEANIQLDLSQHVSGLFHEIPSLSLPKEPENNKEIEVDFERNLIQHDDIVNENTLIRNTTYFTKTVEVVDVHTKVEAFQQDTDSIHEKCKTHSTISIECGDFVQKILSPEFPEVLGNSTFSEEAKVHFGADSLNYPIDKAASLKSTEEIANMFSKKAIEDQNETDLIQYDDYSLKEIVFTKVIRDPNSTFSKEINEETESYTEMNFFQQDDGLIQEALSFQSMKTNDTFSEVMGGKNKSHSKINLIHCNSSFVCEAVTNNTSDEASHKGDLINDSVDEIASSKQTKLSRKLIFSGKTTDKLKTEKAHLTLEEKNYKCMSSAKHTKAIDSKMPMGNIKLPGRKSSICQSNMNNKAVSTKLNSTSKSSNGPIPEDFNKSLSAVSGNNFSEQKSDFKKPFQVSSKFGIKKPVSKFQNLAFKKSNESNSNFKVPKAVNHSLTKDRSLSSVGFDHLCLTSNKVENNLISISDSCKQNFHEKKSDGNYLKPIEMELSCDLMVTNLKENVSNASDDSINNLKLKTIAKAAENTSNSEKKCAIIKKIPTKKIYTTSMNNNFSNKTINYSSVNQMAIPKTNLCKFDSSKIHTEKNLPKTIMKPMHSSLPKAQQHIKNITPQKSIGKIACNKIPFKNKELGTTKPLFGKSALLNGKVKQCLQSQVNGHEALHKNIRESTRRNSVSSRVEKQISRNFHPNNKFGGRVSMLPTLEKSRDSTECGKDANEMHFKQTSKVHHIQGIKKFGRFSHLPASEKLKGPVECITNANDTFISSTSDTLKTQDCLQVTRKLPPSRMPRAPSSYGKKS
ncbi:uncharacterized protein CDAR_295651 [Caerostris darwini]|uniref:CAP-Gly domain-containing protein n=1 Tax=Caerostris darwini TaxID=1538125 RepID=A0AAV4NDB7_9ARAC|nr:uncharacterized protein CDAR_295651 [Caerostris darwini]